MSIQINRAYIKQSFKTLNAYARGETVNPDELAAARNIRLWTYLVADYRFVFDEKLTQGSYGVVMPEAGKRFNGPLGGIAVGNELVMPEDPPARGAEPFILMRLVVPEPSYNIDLSGGTGFGISTTPQRRDDFPAYLLLTEGAITVPGRTEKEQPLQTAGGMKLRTLASQEKLFFPPSYPIPPTI